MDMGEFKRFVERVFRGVFKERPIVQVRKDDQANACLVVNGWTWTHWDGSHWHTRVKPPSVLARSQYPCLRCQGDPPPRERFWQVVIDLVGIEAHFNAHNHIDDACREMGYRTTPPGRMPSVS